ncbi:unnamed protein product [Thelazia callipaeda]|uniref:AWS domain-containing protein n=1 Tax=Thelazia callipaeda TaxID=103827 RepID=A0A0N5CMS3_THECL|nr:unnamed protein product [Thelazia callipaeda]
MVSRRNGFVLFPTFFFAIVTSKHLSFPTHQHHYAYHYPQLRSQLRLQSQPQSYPHLRLPHSVPKNEAAYFHVTVKEDSAIMSAVPGIHFWTVTAASQHDLIRRSVRSASWHHQSKRRQASLSTSVNASTSSSVPRLMKKADTSQIEKEWKTLKKKRKRLRELRQEVRKLSSHLRIKHIFLKDDEIIGDRLGKHVGKETHTRWRKQMTYRVKSIMKRLKRLENKMKTGRSMTKIKRLHSSISQSKNGESGGICFSHKDCKPGLCCHISSSNTNSTSVPKISTCHQYMLVQGESCKDSCQCEARLHCFRSENDQKSGKSVIKSKNDPVK